MNLATPGVDALMDSMAGAQIAQFARKIEKLGYSALWFPEAFGRDPFALAAHLLTVTEKLIVGTAIANVWKREPVAMLGGARTLVEMFPGRFVLGLGISHGPMMARIGINYAKPLSFMRDYLARIKEAPYGAVQPSFEAPIIVAALLPKMLTLAATQTDGTIPTFITPERTAQIRAQIGPDKLICLQQVSMLEKDASKARSAIRGLIRFYLGLPNYLTKFEADGLRRFGLRRGRQRSAGRRDGCVGRRAGDSRSRRGAVQGRRLARVHHAAQAGRQRRGMESCGGRQPRARDARRTRARSACASMNWLMPIVIRSAI